MSGERKDDSPLCLSELIDLESQLQADRSRSRAALRARDERIGQQINATVLSDRALLRRWLKATVDGNATTPGAVAAKLIDTSKWLTVIGGLGLGFGIVAGWLSIKSGKPINSIHLWGALVGLQLALLLVFFLALVPWFRSGLGALLQTPARIVVRVLMFVASRLSPGSSDTVQSLLGRASELDSLYAPLRFWLMMLLTQLFALTLNIGLVTAFVLIPTFSDPAFGWRSTLLETGHVHRATQIIELPWAVLFPSSVISREDIEATEYTSLDDLYAPSVNDTANPNRWARWWPFLLLSLLFYGLLPRCLTALLCYARWTLVVHDVCLDRPGLVELRDRLRRPHVSTRAENDIDRLPHDDGASTQNMPAIGSLAPEAWLSLRWAGLGMGNDELAKSINARLKQPVLATHVVGELDVGCDVAAIEAVRAADAGVGVALLVPAWEPPTEGFLDFIKALRAARNKNSPLAVLLFHQTSKIAPAPPRKDDAALWRTRIAQLGDAYIVVAPLTEGGDR